MKVHRYSVLGTGVEITTDDRVGDHLDQLLYPFVDSRNEAASELRLEIQVSPTGVHRLLDNGEVLAQAPALGVVNRALAEINRAVVGRLKMFAVHAGVVGSGKAVIAFPSRSGTGKSTLTAACLRVGFGYWSDEALVLSSSGEVVPYPKPISLSVRSRSLLDLSDGELPGGASDEVAFTAPELGATIGAGGGRLKHVLTLQRGDGPPRLVGLAPGAIVTALLSHSFNHYRAPETAYRLACQLATACQAWQLTYDDPGAASVLLWQTLMA